MAVVITPKFLLKTYTSGGDPHPTRIEFNLMIEALEDYGATTQKNTAANRPAAGQEGRFFWATDQDRIYYDDGVVWQEISTNGGGGPGTAVVVAGSAAEGSSTRSARADHSHDLPLATDSLNGAMGMLDKAKLDAATDAATPLLMVQRDSSARAKFGDPAVAADAATKGYVDQAIETATEGLPVGGHTHSYASITGKPTTFAPIVGTGAADAKAGNWMPTWSNVTGKPTTFDPVIGTTSTTAKAGSWFPTWTEVTSKPTTFAPTAHSHDWADVTGKPSTFTPSAHTHDYATGITGKPSTFAPSAHSHAGTDVTLATGSVQGAMSATDKAKLDNSTASSTASRLMIRDGSGRAQVASPSSSGDIATKGYVDDVVDISSFSTYSIPATSKPANTPWKIFSSKLGSTTGAGGEARTAQYATDGVGVGGWWFGYQGIPFFDGIVSVQLTALHNAAEHRYVACLVSYDLTRIKYQAARIDRTLENWSYAYGGIEMIITVVGW